MSKLTSIIKSNNIESYSINQIKKAGKVLILNLENNEPFDKDAMKKLSFWRGEHLEVLANINEEVEKIALKVDKESLTVSRPKRAESIAIKLKRYKGKIQLTTMQDIVGCRIITKNIKNIKKIKNIILKDKRYKVVNDYLETPNDRGYRGIHLVAKCGNKSVEVQIRTQIQHSWATAVEIVDLFSGQSIKTDIGDPKLKIFWINISKIFTILEENPYLHEFFNHVDKISRQQSLYKQNNSHKAKEKISDLLNSGTLIKQNLFSEQKKLFESKKNEPEFNKAGKKFFSLCNELDIFKKLNLYSSSIKLTEREDINFHKDGFLLITIREKNNIDVQKRPVLKKQYELNLQYFPMEEKEDANKRYYIEERKASKNKGNIAALVSTETLAETKIAYPNYFADSGRFLAYLKIVYSIQEDDLTWGSHFLTKLNRIFK